MNQIELAVGQEWTGAHGTILLKHRRSDGTWLVSDPVYDEELVISSKSIFGWIEHSGAHLTEKAELK